MWRAHDENQPGGSLLMASQPMSTSINNENAPLGLPAKGISSTRRAVLGSKQSASSALPSVKGGGGRRAFGDITNAFTKQSQPSGTAEKATAGKSGLLLRPAAQQAAPQAAKKVVSSSQQTLDTLARRYAQEGVEKPAGKTWAQLEAERDRKVQQGINQRVNEWSNGLGTGWRSSLMPRLHVQCDNTEDEGDDEGEELSQLRPLAPRLRPRPSALQPAADDERSLLLPSSPLQHSLPRLASGFSDSDFAELA